MAKQIDKYIVIRTYEHGQPIFYEPDFFAATKIDLSFMIKLHGFRSYEALKVENQSELELSSAKAN